MKIKIVQSKYLNTLLVLMLFSAIVHMLILGYFALISGNPYVLNYFNILDIDNFFPGFLDSVEGNAFSLVFVGGLYLFILAKNK
jgi:hypothetical protein